MTGHTFGVGCKGKNVSGSRTILVIFRFILTMCLICIANALGEVGTGINVSVAPVLMPDTIDVGMFYNGTEVQVSADVPECDGAIMVLEAGRDEIKLNRKGRVAGIWLNVAQVTVENVPKVYILATSNMLDNIYSPGINQGPRFGSEYLREQIHFECDKPLIGTEFEEFMRLKSEHGAYNMDVGIDLTPDGSGNMKLSAILPIAPTIPPGAYKVRLYCFEGGHQMCSGEAGLTIKRVGVANMMVNLAGDHAAWYGLLAIGVAMMVGIVMGVVFDSLPGSGH